MTTTVLSCPKCRAPVRLRDGETRVQCTGCGAEVSAEKAKKGAVRVAPAPGAGDKLRQGVVSVSIVAIAAGLLFLGRARRHDTPQLAQSAAPQVIYTAPPVTPVQPTPEGEVAWEPNARAPVVTAVNGDAVEDVIGFFRVWDGRSAWVTHAGAFDGATLKPLWTSDPVDPQILKQAGVLPLAVVVGPRVVIADTSPSLRVFALASGQKQVTLKLSSPIQDVCRAPDGASKVWVNVVDGNDMMLDLVTEKAEAAPRPRWCPLPAELVRPAVKAPRRMTPEEVADEARKKAEHLACDETFLNGWLAHAACHAPASTAPEAGFTPRYELSDGPLAVALGTKGGRPFAVARTRGSVWSQPLLSGDAMTEDAPPFVSELAFGRLYAVSSRVYFDARLTAVDAKTGELAWDAPLVGSLAGPEGPGRGEARSLVATAARVYVVRAGGGLDVFDAATGKPVGTIGKQ